LELLGLAGALREQALTHEAEEFDAEALLHFWNAASRDLVPHRPQ
jgi:hypothetical protein